MSYGQVLVGKVTDTFATAVNKLGTVMIDQVNMKNYRFVKVVDLDVAVGDVLYPASATGAWEVTKDNNGSRISGKVLGIALTTVDISEAPYCWMQIGPGPCAAVRTDGGVAAGDPLVGMLDDPANDGEADTMAAGEEAVVFGFALAADAGDVGEEACVAYLV